jgi:RNA 3'-terminal phosphate cyclase (ATP)
MTIEMDGAAGEGGGQILRTSLALAMCTGQPLVLTRIRAGRPKPGLMRQHLACVQAAAEVCGATVQGAELNSTSLRFSPGPVRGGDYAFNVATAGSCTLVLQTVWPALLMAASPSRLRLGGGTHNPMAPSYHFLEHSYAPLMRRLGAPVELQLRRAGFYPAGGGQFEAVLGTAQALQPFDLMERGPLCSAQGHCLAPALPRRVGRRELDRLGEALGWGPEHLVEMSARQNEGPGNALMAFLQYEHVTEVFAAFGGRGLRSEDVADALVQEVQAYQASEAALGPYLADQWMLPLALAVWMRSRPAAYTCTEVTEHARTNLAVIQRFLPIRAGIEPLPGRGSGHVVRLWPGGAAAGA